MVAHIAKAVYHVPNVVVRNYDPHWRALHETFGLHVVSSASWGAQRMEEMLELIQEFPYLGEKARNIAIGYIESYFTKASDPRFMEKKLSPTCR